jgi:drug/metabolite transporter (DMT)-like permease
MKLSAPKLGLPTFLGLFSIFFWSTTVGVGRSATEQLGPLTAASAIFLWGGTLSLLCFLLSRNAREDLSGLSKRYLFGCGALFVCYMLCLYLSLGFAVNRQQVLEVGLINYLWPTFILLFSVPLLKKKASLFLIPGLLLSSAGVYVTITHQDSLTWAALAENFSSNPRAYLLAGAAALSWAFYSTLSRKWAPGGKSGGVSLFMFATGCTLMALRAIFGEDSRWAVKAFIEILYLGSAVTLAYVFWDTAMRKGDIILIACCSYLTPFLSTLVACLYLQVHAGLKLWLGCALIAVGAVVSKRSIRNC